MPYHTHVDPQPIEPGTTIPYEVEIWPTAYELASGHRLQLRLTSFDVPTHAPASLRLARDVTAIQAIEITPLLPAINTVHQGGDDPSYLVLPVASQP